MRYSVNWQRHDRVDLEREELDDEDKAIARLRHVAKLKSVDQEYDAYVYDSVREERIASLRYGSFYDHRDELTNP